MKLEGYIYIVMTVVITFAVITLIMTEMNDKYGTYLNEPLNTTMWEGRYVNFADEIQGDVEDIRGKIEDADNANGFFDKILAGGGVLFTSVLAVPMIILSSMVQIVYLMGDGEIFLSIPPSLIYFGIILLFISGVFALIKFLRKT